jgi:hypothetical protein
MGTEQTKEKKEKHKEIERTEEADRQHKLRRKKQWRKDL